MPTTSEPTASPTNNSSTADTPATPHPAYMRTKGRRDKCRLLMNGTEAVREAEEDVLLRLVGESDESYDFRVKLCALFNGYERTVKASVGLLLEKDPELGDDMPARMKEIWEDLDLQGTHGSLYTKKVAIDGMVDGYVATLVDFPKVDNAEKLSEEDEQRLGLRPYVARFLANDVLQVRYGKIDGVKRKTLVVLREVKEAVVGLFKITIITRYLVYRHTKETGVTFEIWKSDETGSSTTVEVEAQPMYGKRRQPLSQIPVSLFAPGQEVGDFEWLPTLENLADLNIEHHQVKTNMRNLESLAFVPTIVRIGAQPTKDADGNDVYPVIVLGSRSAIEAPKIEGVATPVYWLSPNVDVLDPGYRSLQDIKADMGAAGLAFLTPDKRSAETAEAKRIDSAAQNATISSVKRALQDHLEEIHVSMGEYLGEKAGSITMNSDFENTILDAATITALGQLAANGKLSIDTLHMLLERGRIFPEGFDRAEELKRILNENRLPPEDNA